MGTSAQYDLQVEDGLIRIEWNSAPSADDLNETLPVAFADPRFKPKASLLYVDHGTRFDLDDAGVRRCLEGLEQHAENLTGRVAVVVKKSLHYGIARIMGSYGELRGIEVRPFHDEQDARRWLATAP